MKPVRDINPLRLPAGSVHCLDGSQGCQVTVLDGIVWLTQAADPRDIVVARGQSFILDRKGLAVVFALRDAALVVGPAGHITAAHLAPPAAWSGGR